MASLKLNKYIYIFLQKVFILLFLCMCVYIYIYIYILHFSDCYVEFLNYNSVHSSSLMQSGQFKSNAHSCIREAILKLWILPNSRHLVKKGILFRTFRSNFMYYIYLLICPSCQSNYKHMILNSKWLSFHSFIGTINPKYFHSTIHPWPCCWSMVQGTVRKCPSHTQRFRSLGRDLL